MVQMYQKNILIFLLNGDASSLDLEMLGEEIRGDVKKKFNINLDWELIRIGDFKKYHNIVILKGGISDEYEISKLTNQVSETLEPLSNVKIVNIEKNSKSLIQDLTKLNQMLFLIVCMDILEKMAKFSLFLII